MSRIVDCQHTGYATMPTTIAGTSAQFYAACSTEIGRKNVCTKTAKMIVSRLCDVSLLLCVLTERGTVKDNRTAIVP